MGDGEDILEYLIRKIIRWFIALFGINLFVIGLIATILLLLFFFVGFANGGGGNLVGENGAGVEKVNQKLQAQYERTADTYWKTVDMPRTIVKADGKIDRRTDPLTPTEIAQAEANGVVLSWGLLASVSKLYNNFNPTTDKEDVPYISPLLPRWEEVIFPSSDPNEKGTIVEWPMEIDYYSGVQTFHIEYRKSGKVTIPVLVPNPFKQDYSRLDKLLKLRQLQNDRDLVLVMGSAFDPKFKDPSSDAILQEFGLKMSSSDLGDNFTGVGGFTGTYTEGYYKKDYTVTQDSGITKDQIDAILNGTPMQGDSDYFLEYGKRFGIDPAFLVGIAYAEQGFRPFNHNAFGITGSGDVGVVTVGTGASLAAFSTDEAGIKDAAKLLAEYYTGDGLTTVEQIWKKWAPGEAKNDPQGLNAYWLNNVLAGMDKVKSE